jgi:hypothetical protein
MLTRPDTGEAATRTVDEQFFDLVCGDADLLAAEFDAIVAAEWPTPPVDSFRRRAAREGAVSGAGRHPAGPADASVARPRQPGTGGWARQRSPPTHDRQEVGDRHT